MHFTIDRLTNYACHFFYLKILKKPVNKNLQQYSSESFGNQSGRDIFHGQMGQRPHKVHNFINNFSQQQQMFKYKKCDNSECFYLIVNLSMYVF